MLHDQQISPFSGKVSDGEPSTVITLRTKISEDELAVLRHAERRIVRFMWALTVLGVLAFLLLKGWSWAIGFALGAGLSIMNFHWLKTAVNSIASAFGDQQKALLEDVAKAPRRPRQWIPIVRFLFRYGLIGLAGYAIFLSSAISLRAFLVGLFIALAALMLEAAYQVVYEIHISSRVK